MKRTPLVLALALALLIATSAFAGVRLVNLDGTVPTAAPTWPDGSSSPLLGETFSFSACWNEAGEVVETNDVKVVSFTVSVAGTVARGINGEGEMLSCADERLFTTLTSVFQMGA